jgi:hypothetical protein
MNDFFPLYVLLGLGVVATVMLIVRYFMQQSGKVKNVNVNFDEYKNHEIHQRGHYHHIVR